MYKFQLDRAAARRNLQSLHHYHDSDFLLEIFTTDYHNYRNRTIECHWHEDLEFHLVMQGQIELNLSGTILMLHPGDCVFVNQNTLHMSRQIGESPAAACFITAFHPQMFRQVLGDSAYEACFDAFLQRTKGFLIHQDLPQGARIVELLRDLSTFSEDRQGYELLCLGRISALWYETMQYIKETQDLTNPPEYQKNSSIAAKKMLAYIYKHYDQPIGIEDLMQYSSLSRSECFRCFKRYIGTSPIEYINEYRLLQSALLLTNTDMGIMEICLACGFSSASYYGKLFKKRYGTSPLAFRRASLS